MKRRTTFRGAPSKRAGMEKSWFANWPAMTLTSVQAWIEALPHNIAEIIRLEGGNEYREGRESKRAYRGRRKVGQLFHHAWLGVDGNEQQTAEDEDWAEYNQEGVNEMTTETESLPDKATKAESTPEIPHIVRKQAPEPSHRVTRSQAKGAGRDENTKAKERQRG